MNVNLPEAWNSQKILIITKIIMPNPENKNAPGAVVIRGTLLSSNPDTVTIRTEGPSFFGPPGEIVIHRDHFMAVNKENMVVQAEGRVKLS